MSLHRHSAEGIAGAGTSAASTGACMIGALGSCSCDGDLGDFFGRCGGLTMSFTHGSVVSSLCEPTRSAVGFGLRGCPAGDCFRVETSPASPQGAASGSRVRFRWTGWVPRLHPRVFVGVPAQWMEFGSKGRGRPAAGNARLAWATTLTGGADHVTFGEISGSCLGQTFNGR